ncbi:C-Maf-inducing protein-like [Argopecten irradians]|uniref:C-Maf-inducing protein-like n=1 Tax=Argopecten irradians TaxID=31199 RepID=UPI003720CA67
MLAISGLDSCPAASAATARNNVEAYRGDDHEPRNMATLVTNLESVNTESSSDADIIEIDDIHLESSPRSTLPYSNGIIKNETGASSNSGNQPCSSPVTNISKPFSGPRFRLINEGDIQICRLNHTRTIVSKIMNSRYLRRWESHRIVLGKTEIHSATPVGMMETGIPYSSIEDVHIISRWDAGQKFCIRITIQDGSLLIQAHNSHLRDQWLHSISWKKHMYKCENLLKNARRPEVLVKEIKNMIDLSLTTPIQDASVFQFPLDLVSNLLQENADFITRVAHENIIVALTPLLENNYPTQEICGFFSKHCKNSPRSSIVIELFTHVVMRIMKHNTDFGKYPRMRGFVQEYVQALNCQNDGYNVVQNFVRSMHGPSSTCPHPRVLPNTVAVCLAAIYTCYEDKKNAMQTNTSDILDKQEWETKLVCYVGILETLSSYSDWRLVLGSLLQPIPFPNDALADDVFTSKMKPVLKNMAEDDHCEVHQTILGIRDGKDGWFHMYMPGSLACDDEGELWGIMLNSLIHCCCKRKKFLNGLNKMVGPIMLLALRENEPSMEVLCAMLEFDVVESNDMKMQMVTTLQSTSVGKRMYAQLCERQIALRELQQKGGPKKLTLPSKSTDADLAKMLSSGSFGNLECLSLAFTHVTSACANDLIKLPSLRYLNLWSTQFGDTGLQMISEYLQKLQVLNLCETPVTDKSLICLSALKNLRKLNLNSTSLSALTFEGLKTKLPALQECDVRYTDAWTL